MNAQQNPFQAVLNSLLDMKKEFPRRYLHQFSDIGPPELQALMEVWERVEPGRKLSLLEELESLAEADTLVSFDDFARALLNDPDSTVRGRAIRLLNECGDIHLIPTYIDILQNDPDAQTRAEAAAALGIFVDLGELEEISEDDYHWVEDTLLAVANGSDDPKVRRRALESLGYSSRPEVVALIESAFRRADSAWQTSAIFAMGRSADSRWDDHILRSLMNENRNIREAAVEAAGQLSIKMASPILLRMLSEEDDDDVMSATIWSLSQIGGEDVRTFLENLLDQTEGEKQIEFLEEALDNLAFTEDLDRFDLLSFDPDDAADSHADRDESRKN